jgi:hypothetical protein
LSRHSRLELELPGTRQFFNEFIDDYWEAGPKTTLTRTLGTRGDLAASYQFSQRWHDSREAREPDGELQLGTRLHFYQHEVVFHWRQHWDSAKRWRTTTKLSLQRNEDNGGGYYDYLRPQFNQQVRYRAEKWEVRADARLSYYHYDHQRTDGPESPRREKIYLRLGLRGERALTKTLKLFAQYDYERAVSNLDIDEYTVNTVFAGLDWEF